MIDLPTATIVVPCYNEEEVLPETTRRFRDLLEQLAAKGLASTKSGAVFVDDGSKDTTWSLIENLSAQDARFGGIKLSGNFGHQKALLCGILNAPGDVLITIDADLQDDVNSIFLMMEAYHKGADIVYGVRSSRRVDPPFKRMASYGYYHLLRAMGVNAIFNHADFRLMSRRTIEALRQYGEYNIYLRGIIPRLGFRSELVFYERLSRFAGEPKYSIRKLAGLALEGITSTSAQPLRLITGTGFAVSIFSFVVAVWAVFDRFFGGGYVPGWASTVVPMFFLGGVQLLSLGVIGEYVAKIYLETKHRPRFIIERVTGKVQENSTRSER